eukprot:TRINITY_DN84987_c0_g1_i1.p1 TRINITY_DN84987_c0_g1~~TRINITY_DN84987_c0_g1_i1.p1  ORF type:complete len:673 (+),score=74.00 TRINITY_DN84987_c0_g1_i1:33-2051(+)
MESLSDLENMPFDAAFQAIGGRGTPTIGAPPSLLSTANPFSMMSTMMNSMMGNTNGNLMGVHLQQPQIITHDSHEDMQQQAQRAKDMEWLRSMKAKARQETEPTTSFDKDLNQWEELRTRRKEERERKRRESLDQLKDSRNERESTSVRNKPTQPMSEWERETRKKFNLGDDEVILGYDDLPPPLISPSDNTTKVTYVTHLGGPTTINRTPTPPSDSTAPVKERAIPKEFCAPPIFSPAAANKLDPLNPRHAVPVPKPAGPSSLSSPQPVATPTVHNPDPNPLPRGGTPPKREYCTQPTMEDEYFASRSYTSPTTQSHFLRPSVLDFDSVANEVDNEKDFLTPTSGGGMASGRSTPSLLGMGLGNSGNTSSRRTSHSSSTPTPPDTKTTTTLLTGKATSGLRAAEPTHILRDEIHQPVVRSTTPTLTVRHPSTTHEVSQPLRIIRDASSSQARIAETAIPTTTTTRVIRDEPCSSSASSHLHTQYSLPRSHSAELTPRGQIVYTTSSPSVHTQTQTPTNIRKVVYEDSPSARFYQTGGSSRAPRATTIVVHGADGQTTVIEPTDANTTRTGAVHRTAFTAQQQQPQKRLVVIQKPNSTSSRNNRTLLPSPRPAGEMRVPAGYSGVVRGASPPAQSCVYRAVSPSQQYLVPTTRRVTTTHTTSPSHADNYAYA